MLRKSANKYPQTNTNTFFFDEGYAIVTNGILLVIQSLRAHNFTKEEINMLNGHAIHREAYEEVLRYTHCQAQDGQLLCRKGVVDTSFKLRAVDDQFKVFDWKKFSKIPERKEIDRIGIYSSYLELINKITLCENKNLVLTFTGNQSAVYFQSDEFATASTGKIVSELIVLMPFKIESL